MPWCPKCKNEYQDGIKVCADCGSELVEELEAARKPLIFGDEEQMRSLLKFLEYSKLKNAILKYDEAEGLYEILVDEKDWQKADSLKRIFLEQENADKMSEVLKHLQEEVEETTQEGEAKNTKLDIYPVYIDSADQAMDSRSSAGIFLAIGGLGLIGSILCMTEIVPFKFANSNLFIDVMAVVFLLFVIMGALSVKRARFFTLQAKTEGTLRETILQWCKENLAAEEIDVQAAAENVSDDGVLYFKRTNILKERINHQFLNLDQGFLDHFIDEQIYDMVFGENTK